MAKHDGGSGSGDGGGGGGGGAGDARTFTAADVDKIVQDRLGRDRASRGGELDALNAKLEKLVEAHQASEARAQQAETRALRTELAAQLPESLRGRVTGATREEIESDVKALLAVVSELKGDGGSGNSGDAGSSDGGAGAGGAGDGGDSGRGDGNAGDGGNRDGDGGNRRPTENLRPGANAGGSGGESTDYAAVADKILNGF